MKTTLKNSNEADKKVEPNSRPPSRRSRMRRSRWTRGCRPWPVQPYYKLKLEDPGPGYCTDIWGTRIYTPVIYLGVNVSWMEESWVHTFSWGLEAPTGHCLEEMLGGTGLVARWVLVN